MALFELERAKAVKKAPQLTPEHVNPTCASKMRVKLAAQIFSHRTASAMRSCSNDLPASSTQTANLIEMFNDMFDFVNSGNLQEVGTRRPALKQLWLSQQEVSY